MLLSGCGAFFPRARTTEQRLAKLPRDGLPLDQPVSVRWNQFAVPYVRAKTDHDAAFALGMIHAHLREGQLALAKRIVYGRLSEIGGPLANDIDQTLRLIGFSDAAQATETALPPATHAWLVAFVDGLNWYQDHQPTRPPEYGLLGISRERWTVADLLSIGRLAGTDINWLTYFSLIGRRDDPDWPEVWARVLSGGHGGINSFSDTDKRAALEGLVGAYARSGSNCVVVSPQRSATGAALLASDPHLGLIVPNLWVLAGVSSPSLNVVGLMPVGLPIFGLGRTRAMAWGGTNMRAASSDLFDATNEPVESRAAVIRNRVLRDKTVTLRRAAEGPIISDSPLFKARPGETVALKWVGHQPSDEVTAFLDAARSSTPDEFRNAFATYAVGAQNMQFADARGNIGQIMATWLPRRTGGPVPSSLVLDPRDPQSQWHGYLRSTDLPHALNPPAGFLASANNPPTTLDVPIGCFFITSERVERLQEILAANPKVTVADLTRLQQDATSPASRRLAAGFVRAIDAAGVADAASDLVKQIRGWDGDYAVASHAPVAFETLLYQVAHRLYGTGAELDIARPRSDWTWIATYLLPDLEARPDRAVLLRASLQAASPDAAKYPTWGDMHFMRVQSIYGNIPVVGRQFRVEEYPTSGSRETVMKTAHGLVRERHPASYGSQSRFVADMSDPDNSWFVLFGGNDGFFGSANFADMIPLWREGRSIRMPLTDAAIAQDFPVETRLAPAPR